MADINATTPRATASTRDRGSRRLLRRAAGERGQGLVEFALVLPVLLLILLGIFSFATTYNSWLKLTDGVRVAGRAAATQLPDADGGVTAACTAAQNAIQANMGSTWSKVQNYSCTAVTVNNDQSVTISAALPFTINIFGRGISVGLMHSTSTERLQ